MSIIKGPIKIKGGVKGITDLMSKVGVTAKKKLPFRATGFSCANEIPDDVDTTGIEFKDKKKVEKPKEPKANVAVAEVVAPRKRKPIFIN